MSPLPDVQNEVERGRLAARRVAERDQEFWIEDPVGFVGRFSRKVELGGKNRSTWGLDSHVEVARAPGVESRHDRLETAAPEKRRETHAESAPNLSLFSCLHTFAHDLFIYNTLLPWSMCIDWKKSERRWRTLMSMS